MKKKKSTAHMEPRILSLDSYYLGEFEAILDMAPENSIVDPGLVAVF
jgi:hypothetical protein